MSVRRVVAALGWAAGIGLLLAAPLSAQRTVTYTVIAAPVFPTATSAQYGTGVTPGLLVNTTGMTISSAQFVRSEIRTAILDVRGTTATLTGPFAKAVGEVSACWSASCTWVPLRTAFQTIATIRWPSNGTPTTLAGTAINFRAQLRWEADLPGVYRLGVESRLTITSP